MPNIQPGGSALWDGWWNAINITPKTCALFLLPTALIKFHCSFKKQINDYYNVKARLRTTGNFGEPWRREGRIIQWAVHVLFWAESSSLLNYRPVFCVTNCVGSRDMWGKIGCTVLVFWVFTDGWPGSILVLKLVYFIGLKCIEKQDKALAKANYQDTSLTIFCDNKVIYFVTENQEKKKIKATYLCDT